MKALKQKMNLVDFAKEFDYISKFNMDGIFLEEIKLYRKKKKMILNLKSSNIVALEDLQLIIAKLKKNMPIINKIEISINYDIRYKEIDELIKLNWNNVLFILKENIPAIESIEDKVKYKYVDNVMSVFIDEPILLIKSKERNVSKSIESYFEKNFATRLRCEIVPKNDIDFNISDYKQEKEKEKTILMNKIIKNDHNQYSKIKRNDSQDRKSPFLLYGRHFSGQSILLKDISHDLENIIVEGKLFSIDQKKLNKGGRLFVFQITDYTNSITVKVFERKNQKHNLINSVHIGESIKIRGNLVYDKYLKENVIIASDVLFIPNEEKKDVADIKRIELHLHTQMSSMDGVSKTSELIKTAANWGHEAIAITDHGTVQAFPEAMLSAKKYNIKVIYGLEGYLVNDSEKLIRIKDKIYSFDDEYVIFDIETTGLSNIYDRITEIGAIKIKEKKIIDSFSSLVNPQMSIPNKITELTGITNEMVKDSPAIKDILPEFLKFIGDSPLVAHNASFDIGFIRQNAKKLGYSIENTAVDTLMLSRILLKHLKRHRLNIVAKDLNVSLENHHRAVDDAMATTEIFIKLVDIMNQKNIYSLQDINEKLGPKIDVRKLDTYHVILLAQNKKGLKNLYKIVSESHLNYFFKKPRIPKSLLNKYRDGIIVGSACEAGELYQALLDGMPMERVEKIASYYDYLEIQPLDNNKFLIENGLLKGKDDLKNINFQIVGIGDKLEIPVVATGDVHFLREQDEYYRRILMAGQGYSDADYQAPLYFKTTNEMLNEFKYLGEKKARQIVIDNPHKINEKIDKLIPIPDGTFPPEIDGADEELKRLSYTKAKRIYGEQLPAIVKNRLDREVNSIISNGYAVMYIIAHKLVDKSLKDGYLVGSRGSVGSSFAATMSDITEVNPLPPHYICPECKFSEFITDGTYGSGVDLPDKDCPQCNHKLLKEGHDIPFEVFLGFEGDKEPDIDLNFAGEYQSEAHKYTEELFGEGKVFRAGTIGTIADKTAYGFVRKYLEEKQLDCNQAEINRLTLGCTGVRRTSGQHPGGVIIVPADKDIHEFSPIQYPANDASTGVITTHFDYHSISGRLLKLDILGHDVPSIIKMLEDITNLNAQHIPLDDKKTMSIFTSTAELNIVCDDYKCQVGTLGIPEFGTKFVRQMLIDTQPCTFAELVRISGLSHGTDVWINNAQDLVKGNVAELKEVISTRDDIMNFLILKKLPSKDAFNIMENVRKGKGLKSDDEDLMRQNNVPEWYIDSCNKIKYMFPKAHAVAYVMMSFRIAYFKVYYPQAFYATYFTMKAEDFDADLISKGKDMINEKITELENMGNSATAKGKNLLTVLEVALEMYSRGIGLLEVDLYKSDPDKFIIADNVLLPPLKSLQGLGQNAARSIALERERGEFLSIEDLRQRTKVTKTVIETLINHGCIAELPSTNQLSFF